MIDLHSHILPGIDDGPVSLDESLEMARLYQEAGFSKVVATPHWIAGSDWMPGASVVQQAVSRLNEAIREKGLLIQVFSGMEIAMDGGIPDLFEQGRLLSIANGPYLLIEPPFQQMPLGWKHVFFALMSKGYRVILAHPERCGQFAANLGMLDDIVASGVFLQVNYDSFLGRYGKGPEKTARYLASKGCVHLLATDSHDIHSRHPGLMKDSLKVVRKAVGEEAAELMSRVNPEQVLDNGSIKAPEAVEQKPKRGKKNRWGLF